LTQTAVVDRLPLCRADRGDGAHPEATALGYLLRILGGEVDENEKTKVLLDRICYIWHIRGVLKGPMKPLIFIADSRGALARLEK
jgi:hypothetical protein